MATIYAGDLTVRASVIRYNEIDYRFGYTDYMPATDVTLTREKFATVGGLPARVAYFWGCYLNFYYDLAGVKTVLDLSDYDTFTFVSYDSVSRVASNTWSVSQIDLTNGILQISPASATAVDTPGMFRFDLNCYLAASPTLVSNIASGWIEVEPQKQ